MNPKPRILCITGPTASGKSALALDLAKILGGELINIDSVQVYRGFDLGSAKPNLNEQSLVRHHLIDVCSPLDTFDAMKCTTLARAAIEEALTRGALPIIVGGTGLYLRSVLCGLPSIKLDPGDKLDAVHEQIASAEAEIGRRCASNLEFPTLFHSWLAEVDAIAAARVGANDLVRMRRAATVKLFTGRSIVEFQDEHGYDDRPYSALVLSLFPETRQHLYQRINWRVEWMIENGLVKEVRDLVEKWGWEQPALGAIGYRQVVEHLRGELELPLMGEKIKQETRNFAKRQMTWWRHQPRKLGWSELPGNILNLALERAPDNTLAPLVQDIRNFLDLNDELAKEEICFMPLSVRYHEGN